MEFFEVLKTRRSVRKYTADPVPPDVIPRCIDAALIAPNSSNMQPWEFYWVRSPQKKAELSTYCFSQPAASTAPELVVAVARRDTWRRNQALMLAALSKNSKVPASAITYYKKIVPFAYVQGWFSSIGLCKSIFLNVAGLFRPVPRNPCSLGELDQVLVKTTALACENFMLAAVAQGYGCCPMEGFDEVRVKKLLGLPKYNSRVVMVMSVGKTDPKGIFGPQMRFERDLFAFEV